MYKVLLLAVALSVSSFSAQANAEPDRAAQVEQKIVELKDRLNLTDEQRTQVENLLSDQAEKRRELLVEFGIDPKQFEPGTGKKPLANLSFREKRKLGAALKDLKQENRQQFASILDAQQLAEYDAIQAERAEKMRSRLGR